MLVRQYFIVYLYFFLHLLCRLSIISQYHSMFLRDRHVWEKLSRLRSSVCPWIHTGEPHSTNTLFWFTLPFILWSLGCLEQESPSYLISAALFRSELNLQPILEDTTEDDGKQFELSEGFSYEDILNRDTVARLQQTCRQRGEESGLITINIVPVKDTVTCKEMGDIGENFDVPFVLHLWPSVLLRNLLPYPIAYKLKVGRPQTFRQLSVILDTPRTDSCPA